MKLSQQSQSSAPSAVSTAGLDVVTSGSSIDRVGAIVSGVAAQHGLRGPFAPNDFLVDRGLTSMAMVDLMLAVEAEFDVTIPQHELTPANFQSMEALARLLDRL